MDTLTPSIPNYVREYLLACDFTIQLSNPGWLKFSKQDKWLTFSGDSVIYSQYKASPIKPNLKYFEEVASHKNISVLDSLLKWALFLHSIGAVCLKENQKLVNEPVGNVLRSMFENSSLIKSAV